MPIKRQRLRLVYVDAKKELMCLQHKCVKSTYSFFFYSIVKALNVAYDRNINKDQLNLEEEKQS